MRVAPEFSIPAPPPAAGKDNAGAMVFRYYGGKWNHLRHLLPLMETPHRIFVEPFAGSLAVTLNKPQASISVASDMNGDVINFFRALREQPDALLARLRLTIYHPAEYETAKASLKAVRAAPQTPDIERARQFYALMMMSFNGMVGAGFSTLGPSKGQARGKGRRLADHVDSLSAIVERLRHIDFVNDDAVKVMRRYDAADSLIYADPPYIVQHKRKDYAYKHRYKVEQHEEMLHFAQQARGKMLISGYQTPLYDDALKDWGCIRYRKNNSCQRVAAGERRREVIETLWFNYEPQQRLEQLPLEDKV